jgi:hypothetical protein
MDTMEKATKEPIGARATRSVCLQFRVCKAPNTDMNKRVGPTATSAKMMDGQTAVYVCVWKIAPLGKGL